MKTIGRKIISLATYSRIKNEGSESDVIHEVATDWFLKMRDGDLSEEEFNKWKAWISSDFSHEKIFDEIASFWELSSRLTDVKTPISDELNLDTYDGEKPVVEYISQSKQLSAQSYVTRALASAAVILLLFGTYWLSNSDLFMRLEDETYYTSAGEHRTITLSDGTEITLGAQSEIDVKYSPKTRKINFSKGEAYFDVAKDVDRPFVVQAGPRVVRAVGTAFNINIGLRDIEVTVIEGKVDVSPAQLPSQDINKEVSNQLPESSASSAQLIVGDLVSYDRSGNLSDIEKIDPVLTVSWRHGTMIFVDKPLVSVIYEVNRYSDTHISIVDKSIEELRITGTVQQKEVRDWLIGLEKALPIRLVETDEHGVLIIEHDKG